MSQEPWIPSGECALGDPRTREALRHAPRPIWIRFAKMMGGGLVVMIPSFLSGNDFLLAIGMIATVFVITSVRGLLISYAWLHRIKRVLSVYPWEAQPEVEKCEEFAAGSKATALIKLGRGNGEWTVGFAARNYRSLGRWDQQMEKGVWFAGDLPFGGVIARPGGEELTFVQADDMTLLAAEREAASTARQERAKEAGLGKELM